MTKMERHRAASETTKLIETDAESRPLFSEDWLPQVGMVLAECSCEVERVVGFWKWKRKTWKVKLRYEPAPSFVMDHWMRVYQK